MATDAAGAERAGWECLSLCILLAEDEFLIRDVAQEYLKDAGYEVLTAGHGREAMDHLDRHPGRFTCLVTDYHMPHAHGAQVIEHLRGINLFMPVILASAYPQATTQEWRDHHRVALMLKPYRMADLVGLVKRLLS